MYPAKACALAEPASAARSAHFSAEAKSGWPGLFSEKRRSAENASSFTGSHNLGYKASFNNDENLAIIRGNKRLAAAYASHVLDVYDHFAWRYQVETFGKPKAQQSLETNPAKWQERYFDSQGRIKVAQVKFWLSALA